MAGTTDAQALLLTVSADTSKAVKALDALNQKLSGIAPEMQRHAKRGAEAVEKEFSKIDPGKALKKVFDSARFNVIEEGSAKLRVFGSAIEPLGPLGIAAAAGVVALGEAFAKSREAIEYADSIYKAAQAAHVSTDTLQEFRQAVEKAGGDTQAAGPALLAFSETLGKASEGLKGLRPFQALFGKGFGVADVKALGDTEHALDAVVAKIQNLRSRSEQDAAISQFGLQGLAQLILAGADAWKEYREETRKSGEVLDASVIRKAHELSTQLDELTTKIKNDLTTAFVNLGPVLVRLLGYVVQMLDKVKDFTKELGKTPAGQKLLADVAAKGPFPGIGGTIQIEKDVIAAVRQKAIADKVDFSAGRKFNASDNLFGGAAPHGTGHLADLTKTGTDHTAEFDKAAIDALNSAREAEARAVAALTQGILAHAEAEKSAVDLTLSKKLADLEIEAQKIAASKNDADKLAQRAKINSAKVAEQQAAEAQKQLIDQQATTKALEEWLSYADRIRGEYSKIASNAAHMAVTAADRNAIETRDLLANQKRELDDLDQRQANSLVGKSGGDLDRQISENKATRASVVDRQASDRQVQAFDQAGPLEKYLRGIQDLNTEFQTDGVEAIQSLTSGLIDAALHARNLGDVLKNTFLTLLQQILTQSLTKEAAPGLASGLSSLLHFIPGFAGGTDSAPGGLALVGEKGPELVNLPKGATVTPSFKTLDALNAMKAPAARAPVVYAPAAFDLRGAVVTQDLLDQMNSISSAHAQQAAQAGRALAVQDVRRAGYIGGQNQ